MLMLLFFQSSSQKHLSGNSVNFDPNPIVKTLNSYDDDDAASSVSVKLRENGLKRQVGLLTQM